MKSPFSRAEDVADFLNTERQTEKQTKGRQRNLSQMKGLDKATAGDLSKTDISNMPDGVFKAKIIRTLIGLEKRVEGMREMLNRDKE